MGVESHVLRYWEEELNVSIPRNEMGHRYYTENHINLLKNVRDLKDQGYSLRTIKMMLTDPDRQDGNKGMVMTPAMQQNRRLEVSEPSGSKMEQFQEIMDKVVANGNETADGTTGKGSKRSRKRNCFKGNELSYADSGRKRRRAL